LAKSVDFHILFQNGRAREALDLYEEIFDDFTLDQIELYRGDGDGPANQVKVAAFRLLGRRFVCIDSPIQHEWDMTPGIAPFVECDDDAELERLFEALSDDGTVHMPLGAYGFGRRFGWVEDRFGVPWLLNLA
jgi:predicted 3-demethylubiquinone-9 3-methyltransferase (glyoxalase superfamily)